MTTADKIRALPIPAYLSPEVAFGFACGRDAAAAIVEAEPPQAVRVKPLVWIEDGPEWPNCFHAISAIGRYEIAPFVNGVFSCHVEPEMRDIGLRFLTPEAAKAAGQADYEARSLATIELTPTSVDASPAPDPVSKTPALDALAMREKVAAVFDERHRVYMTGKGRDPSKYTSGHSMGAEEIRALPMPDHAAALAEAMQLPEVKALVDALTKAANRLDWCAGLIASDNGRDRAGVWADEAHAAPTEAQIDAAVEAMTKSHSWLTWDYSLDERRDVSEIRAAFLAGLKAMEGK